MTSPYTHLGCGVPTLHGVPASYLYNRLFGQRRLHLGRQLLERVVALDVERIARIGQPRLGQRRNALCPASDGRR